MGVLSYWSPSRRFEKQSHCRPWHFTDTSIATGERLQILPLLAVRHKRDGYISNWGESAENEMFKSSPTLPATAGPCRHAFSSHAKQTAFLHRLDPKRFTTCFTFKPWFQRGTMQGSSRTIRSNLMCYLNGLEWMLLWGLFCGKYSLDAKLFSYYSKGLFGYILHIIHVMDKG